MESSDGSGESGAAPRSPHAVRLILRGGFRGHTVAITVDQCELLRAVGVITDPVSTQACVMTVGMDAGTRCFTVSVVPGNLVATFEVDTAAHPQIAISLLGEGTVAFEASAILFP